MKVIVRFFTSLREITGKREETLQFTGDKQVNVDEVLKMLSKEYGEEFVEYVYVKETGAVKSFLQFLVNGKNTPANNLATAILSDGDILAILPPVGGG